MKISVNIKCVFLLILAFLAVPALSAPRNLKNQKTEIFVSTVHTSAPEGTIENPLNSFADAKDYVRDLISAGNNKDIVVYFREGVYQLENTIEFDINDSGSDKFSITYKAYQGEQVVISGGRLIENWTRCENGLWHANADFDFRQLYVNDKRAVRARTPENGYYQLKGWDIEGKRFIIEPQQITQWKNFDDSEIIIQHVWAESILKLESFTIKDGSAYIEPKEPLRTLIFDRPYPRKINKLAFHFENAFEFLDQSGEFYLDKKENKLYYKPMPDQDMTTAKVVAPYIQTLISIKGTLDSPVKNLKFEGFTFEHSTWLEANEKGVLNMQAGIYNTSADKENNQRGVRGPSAVYLEAAHQIVFERNVFRNLGACGLDLHYGTYECVIRGNVFVDIAGNGIQHSIFSKPDVEVHIPYNPEDTREICRYDVISNNFISRIGLDYYGSVGIGAGYARGIMIEHNEVTDVPYSGISVGWGWCNSPNAMANNMIRYNRVSKVMTLLSDGGAIYTLSPQPLSQIAYNYIYDLKANEYVVHSDIKGIYLDEGSNGFNVHHNVVYNTPYKIFTNRTGANNVFSNNYLLADQGVREYAVMEDEHIKRNSGLEPAFEDIKKGY